MKYFLYVMIFYTCCACQPAETAPLTNSELISPWAKSLLQRQSCSQDSCIAKMDWALQKKLPGGNLFFGNLQVNALEFGSQKSLEQVYQKIIFSEGNETVDNTKQLNLSFQDIHFIPNKIVNYTNLIHLYLQNNQIQSINPKLAQCKKLKKIDLSSNGMQSIPFGILYLNQIEEIILADNHLSSLPPYFYNLHNLRVIDLSNLHTEMAEYHNDFTELPSVLTQMPQVEKLFLEKLSLRKLPPSLKNMTNLHVLSLNENRDLNLQQAFEVLATLPNLIALDLSFLGRRILPQNIAKLKNLKVLLWHEEKQINRKFIEETLKRLLPNTKIYFGEKGVGTPFLRGNSIETIRNAGN